MQTIKSGAYSRRILSFLKYKPCLCQCELHTCTRIPKKIISNDLLSNPISKLNVNFAVSAYSTAVSKKQIDDATFDKISEETLISLSEYFERAAEDLEGLKKADISYNNGVLTINLGKDYGTYVINRQSPNKQIWLSSPMSGPKRYDFVADRNCWIYKHSGETLHHLLQQEISEITDKVDFSACSYSEV